jgi:penicillin-binding protein 1A
MNKIRGQSHFLKRHRRQKLWRSIRMVLGMGVVCGTIGLIGLTAVLVYLHRGLPDVTTINTYIPAETTKIYSHDGVVLAELHEEENRVLKPIESISPILKQTVIAMEDTDFYDHNGLNAKSIMRALYRDIIAMEFVEGGSTLTQQLARNLFLTKRKTILRKLEEALLAIQIEKHFTKTDILEMYLNQVYWGHNTYGIESASQYYFGKSSQNLRVAESAMLVGLLKGPELYSPLRNKVRAKRRQRVVLNRMAALGLITEAQAQQAYVEELIYQKQKKLRYKAPYFTSHVLKQLIELYGEKDTYTSGLKVRTTLNYRYQEKAKAVVDTYIAEAQKPHWIKKQRVDGLGYSQAAILAMDPRTGYILAMQGGNDFLDTQFNRVTQAQRQPGSAFKPFVYLTALEHGFSPGSFIDDSEISFNTIEGVYTPQNYNKKFRGLLPMRRALELSVNVVAVKLNDMVTPEAVVRTAKQIGIAADLKPVLSLPLGAFEVTMIDLAAAYGVFANNGIRVEPVSILSIEDRNGTVLYKHQHQEKQVYSRKMILALVDMMTGVLNYGTGRNARLPRPIAGKTGTTSNYKDAWFFGFIPQMVTVAWVGNDDNEPMNQVTGGWIPALMWRDFMKYCVQDINPQRFPSPTGLVSEQVSWATGKLAGPQSETVTMEKYWVGREPKEIEMGTMPMHESAPVTDLFDL